MIRKNGLALAIALTPLVAQAGVTEATLYPSHAQVTWEETAQVTSGTGVLKIEGLPVSLQDRDVRVALEGIKGSTVQQVRVRRHEQAEAVPDEQREIQAHLALIQSSIQEKRDHVKAWTRQATLMSQAAGSAHGINASELDAIAITVRERTREALDEIRALKAEMADDLATEDKLERKLAGITQQAMASKTVWVYYQAPADGTLSAQVKFQTSQAIWRSEYSARLQSELDGRPGGEVTLEHQAIVIQNTGLDWEGVTLRLSTADTRRGTAMMEPSSWVVNVSKPRSGEHLKGMGFTDAVAGRLAKSSGAVHAEPERQSAFTQHYEISQPVDVPSNREGQRLTVARHVMPVDVETWVRPAVDETAYLHATGTLELDAPIPAGPVTLYRDGQSVGQTTLPVLADGEELSLGFGVDDGVRVRVVRDLEGTAEEGFFWKENTHRRQNLFEVTNHHRGAVRVRVFDRIPVSEQDTLTVKPLKITEPVVRDVDDKKGVLAWDYVIKPEGVIEIQSGFEVRVPEGVALPNL